MTAFDAIIWTCTLIFVATGTIAVLALINKVKLGQTAEDHERYLRTLFNFLIMGIIFAGVCAFAMYLKDKMTAFEVVVWSCAAVFLATGLIACLALINKLRLGDSAEENDFYKKKLFRFLIVEIIVAGVAAFALYLKDYPVVSQLNKEKSDLVSQNRELQTKLSAFTDAWGGDVAARDHWASGTAHWSRAQKEIGDADKYNESLRYALEEYNLALGTKLDNPYNRVHVATVLNELGRYPDAEKEIMAVYKLPAFTEGGKATLGWGLSELAAALYLQNKVPDYERVAGEAYAVGANFRDYIPKTIKKYQENDGRRASAQEK